MLTNRQLSCLLSFLATLLSLSFCTPARAEEQPGAADAIEEAATIAAPEQSPSSAAPGTPVADPKDPWHVGFTFYLWFPGVHGTTGIGGRDVTFSASPGDLLSHFRFGLMGLVTAEHNRWVLLSDLVWVRLQANQQRVLPLPGQPQLTAQVKSWQLLVNPEFGYRFLDGEKIKMDALPFGVRYWHLGSSLALSSPSVPGRTFSGSQNWADPVMGARIVVPFTPRTQAVIWGDAGGWGAGAQLDYNIVGALEFKLNPKFTLDAGWRYLYVNYISGTFLYKTAMSGVAAGVTYNFK
jgi:outer membrane receptor protein involved in Fe transport